MIQPKSLPRIKRKSRSRVVRKTVKQPAMTTTVSRNGASMYEPISSVWDGSDGELLELMFKFYAVVPVEPVLDATYNAGRFWRGSKREVVSMDIDPQYKPMIVGDNRKMVGVPSGKFGVVVYDPPHVGPQGRDKSCKKFDVDFGATVECGKERNWNLSYLYPPFLKQAKRVLKPDGLLLAKITDMVNNHRSKWAHSTSCVWRKTRALPCATSSSRFAAGRWSRTSGIMRTMP